jgi:hypothetical protein
MKSAGCAPTILLKKQERKVKRQRPGAETRANDDFVTDMWRTHRASAPEQEMSGNNLMWVWKGRGWEWLPNPKEYVYGK